MNFHEITLLNIGQLILIWPRLNCFLNDVINDIIQCHCYIIVMSCEENI